jgi:hypothetical protein
MRDFIGALVADVLGNRFLKILVRPLAFNDAKRNAVHEKNDVRPPCPGRARTLNVELLANMEGIVGGIDPIDVFQRPSSP